LLNKTSVLTAFELKPVDQRIDHRSDILTTEPRP